MVSKKDNLEKDMSNALIIYAGSHSKRKVIDDDELSYDDSFEVILNSSPPQHKNAPKKRPRSEYVEGEKDEDDKEEEEFDEESSSREAMKKMAKCIKLFEVEIRPMLDTQLKMHRDMEALIKKTVNRASRHVLKATDKLTKSNEVLKQAASTAK